MAQGDKPEIEKLDLQDWSQKTFIRSKNAMWVTLMRYLLAFIVAEIGLFLIFLLNATLSINFATFTSILGFIVGGVMVSLIPIFIALVFIIIAEWTGTTYTLTTGQYRVVGDFVDQRHGKVKIDVQGVFHRENMYPVNLFIRAELLQPFWARALGYGNVRLVPRPNAPEVRSVIVPYINDPENFLKYTQELIDSAIGIDNQLGT